MSKSPAPTTLPAIGRGSSNSTATAGAAASIAGEGTPSLDYVALYRQYCTEEGCKANSAFVRYIQDRDGHFSLERLNLGHNYLGSKGLRPVLRMIDLCQTIVSVNLEDNGIGNDAVAELCEVLERHVSIATLNLRRNPISVVGGKRLLQLAEANPRITEILTDGTDIFGGLQERIRMALQHNVAVAQGTGLQMEANKEKPGEAPDPTKRRVSPNKSSRANQSGVGVPKMPTRVKVPAAATMPPPNTSLQLIHSLSGPLSSAAVAPAHGRKLAAAADGAALKDASAAPTTATTPMTSPSSASMERLGWQEAALGRTQPRPPPPAVASHTTKALPVNKVVDLKALFAERARLHTEVNRGEASRRAYAVREELQALERHGRPVVDADTDVAAAAGKSVGVYQTYPGASPYSHPSSAAAAVTATIPLLPPLQDDEGASVKRSNKSTPNRDNAERPSPTSPVPMHASSDEPVGAVQQNSGVAVTTALDPTDKRASAVAAAAADSNKCAVQALSSSAQPGTVVSNPRPLAHTVEDVLSPSRMMLLTTEEQFTVLFDQGCREYANRNLDAAYMAWNEAMRLAVSEGQREWMAVVASNLQRLSYELLVEEGASHLEHGELEKAAETFNLALEVAVKAKNAVWERDMRLAKQNVQKALFHRCHEAALLLFSRAQEDARGHVVSGTAEDKANEVTEDDYFVLPGTEEMVRHTPAFVREWSCLLLLKEAIGLWGEGTRVVSRLSEVAAAPLRENITEALNLVASFIVQRHFNNTTPTGLLWFNTDGYLYHECVLLSDLWYDLVADSEQSLHHPLLGAVCAALLGELYVATFQLPQALVQLDKLVRYGRTHRSPVLEAAGLTLCGRVHLQRANHALAEAALEAALELWASVQSDPVVKRLIGEPNVTYDIAAPMDTSAVTAEMTATTTTAPNASTAAAPTPGGGDAFTLAGGPNAEGGHSGSLCFRVEAHLPPDAISVLASACRQYKVRLLLQTYRYRDALETLEYGLNVAYSDTLQEKLGRNYHLNPSLDEIAAIAGVLRTSMVYYTLTSRYDWAATQNAYQVEESLCMWVLAESREMRFVEVNLTNDFKCSMQELLSSLRQRLCVEPEMALQSEIVTELPSRSWQEPLRVLYQACIHPIIGYLRAADPQLLFGDGVITVVPTGLLWLVPFHALLNVKAGDRYLVEEVAIQLAFSATQAAFASLSAERVQQRDLHREVVAVQTDTDHGMADSMFYSAFPFNADRSTREGEVVATVLRAGQAQVAERQLKRASAAAAASSSASVASSMGHGVAVFTHKVEVVENVEALRAVLPRARTLHIATATTAGPPLSLLTGGGTGGAPVQHLLPLIEERRGRQRVEDEGGLLMSAGSPMGDTGIVRAAEIAHMELFAEHVILTNTNMSRDHVRGIRDDVLGLVRSFFGSGVPCVIAGQWCTPDMEPMELFQRFYTLWCRPPTASSEGSLRTMTQTTTPSGRHGSESGVSESASEAVSARAESLNVGSSLAVQASPRSLRTPTSNNNTASDYEAVNGEGGGEEDEGEVLRHRALLLARSIRRLLTEEPATRYRPRVWAGYYCMGTGW
ncbi:hypothetical protein ABB37_06309 [Leptomonas pyrrhocoris]|uniref:CHAT domain-containing protein n=1 Tax=Leptomonas pyrrhocoris TaxID=157538 RepID=A0A0M9FXJ1_LEPPY|nr:hypothetical protein ABB37_06309 [Leptomonas pyrrhocoris]XP_015656564.1 hypothetical protein ABB37_06309 [Leptomonas pyrrhocoris]KPA78124.1 hypothetical protein ABB37_06309 [Leptomonas pyrrhocoris]KPA78125.1 hypothetical protein ABB37_06309 [Leptomonas pyrrhocoris]|eukprot:XP_015656563.1 hypothetical protein ABB37_06309 [Leptomonas pyrrhocoris]